MFPRASGRVAEAPPLGREPLVRTRHHRLVRGIARTTSAGAEPLRRVAQGLDLAVGGLRPSSFSPWRLTQITGTFIFSSGAMSFS